MTDGRTDRQTDGQTDGRRRLQYPQRFLKKRGDKKKTGFQPYCLVKCMACL